MELRELERQNGRTEPVHYLMFMVIVLILAITVGTSINLVFRDMLANLLAVVH